MHKMTIFYLTGCPYCRNAERAVRELLEELPSLSSDMIEWIEERQNADVADRYDYYCVPSLFSGEKKLYECSPGDDYAAIKRQLKQAIETVLSE
jgi:glutaredoxin